MDTPNLKENTLNTRLPGAFSRLVQLIRENKYPLLSALIFGFFSYMFTFTNKLVIHDDLEHLFSKGYTVSSGRWGLSLLSFVLPDISMPWFHGCITILLIAAAICLVVRLLKIGSPLLQVLTAGLIICFPSLTGTFGYMFTSSSYGVAFLLAVLAAWGLSRGSWKGALGGILACILSLSIYQAYISITVTLLVLVLIRKTLYTEVPVKKIFFEGLYFIGGLILSLGLYWVATRLIQTALGIPMNWYAASAMEDESILTRVVNCVKTVFYILLLGYKGLVHEGLVQILHFIFLAVLLFELVFWCCREKKAGRIGMLVFLLAVFPFSLNAVLLFTSLSSAHSLVLYGFAGIYVLTALVLDGNLHLTAKKPGLDKLRSLGMDLAILCLAMVVYSNASTANRAAFNLHLRYESNYSMGTSILTQLESLPGFETDTPVAVIGYFPQVNDYDRMLDVNHITGVSEHATRGWDVPTFLRYYCGADCHFLKFNEMGDLFDHPDFHAMPFFPDNGSIAMVDGTAVVKLDPYSLPEEYLSRILADDTGNK